MSKYKDVTSPQLRFTRGLDPKNFRTRGGFIHQWVGTHWQRMESSDIESLAIEWLANNVPEKTTEKCASSSVATAVLLLPDLQLPRKNCIPTLNGTVEISPAGAVLRESRRIDALDFVIDCGFHENATAPLFDSFIKEALPNGDVRNFLQEYSGYTLLSDTRHQVAAWLIGQGGSGKGTFAQVMRAVHRQTVALNLEDLDGFKLASLQSASLVLVDETPARIDEQKIKSLISGDVIQVDIKYRDPVTIRPTAKWLVNGNSLPSISDHSTGFWRRWLIFPFSVLPAKCTPMLAENIIENELAGVLNWCLEGLVRLLIREKFPPLPEEMQQAIDSGKRSTDNVREWVVDVGIKADFSGTSTRREVYSFYNGWCGESGTRPVSSKKFWERCAVAIPDMKSDRSRQGGERDYRVNIRVPSDHY